MLIDQQSALLISFIAKMRARIAPNHCKCAQHVSRNVSATCTRSKRPESKGKTELVAVRDTSRPTAARLCLRPSFTRGLIITLNKAILQSILSARERRGLWKGGAPLLVLLLIPLAVLDLH